MNITEFLKERNITDSDFMETGMTSYIIDLVNEYEAVKSKLILPVVSGMFSEQQMEDAYNSGAEAEQQRCGYFDIENYR